MFDVDEACIIHTENLVTNHEASFLGKTARLDGLYEDTRVMGRPTADAESTKRNYYWPSVNFCRIVCDVNFCRIVCDVCPFYYTIDTANTGYHELK